MNLSDELMWTDQASCKGLDTNDFFVDDGNKRYENEPYLKRICSNCPVRLVCLDYALNHAVTGWWGGMSEKNRRSMRQRLGIIAKSIVSEGEGSYK